MYKKKQVNRIYRSTCKFIKKGLLILSLSCSFRLLLTLYAGLFIVLSLTELCEYTGACTLLLEATKSVIKRFAFSELNFCHFYFPPLANKEINGTIIHQFGANVNRF